MSETNEFESVFLEIKQYHTPSEDVDLKQKPKATDSKKTANA